MSNEIDRDAENEASSFLRERASKAEFEEAVTAERTRQIEKGYTPEHDDAHGAKHLINLAADYAVKGEPVKSVALLVATLQHLDRQATIHGANDSLIAALQRKAEFFRRFDGTANETFLLLNQAATTLAVEQVALRTLRESHEQAWNNAALWKEDLDALQQRVTEVLALTGDIGPEARRILSSPLEGQKS